MMAVVLSVGVGLLCMGVVTFFGLDKCPQHRPPNPLAYWRGRFERWLKR